MTLAELLAEWRVRLDDIATPQLWSDDEGVAYANAAENEACERAKLIEEDSLSNVQTLDSLTQTAGVATASKVAHGFQDGARVRIAGANQAGYNVEANVTVSGPDTFTYPVANATVSPATGTITATLVAATLVNIAGQANVGTYPLDSRIIEIRSVMWNGRFLTPIARETLNDVREPRYSVYGDAFDTNNQWQTAKGSPIYFIDPQQHYLTLVRIPTVAADIHLSVYRRPLAPMALTELSRGPEIHAAHHIHLVEWMEHLAYNKRDADAHDPKLAAEKEALFTARFGIRPDANVRRQQRARRSNTVRMNPSW